MQFILDDLFNADLRAKYPYLEFYAKHVSVEVLNANNNLTDLSINA